MIFHAAPHWFQIGRILRKTNTNTAARIRPPATIMAMIQTEEPSFGSSLMVALTREFSAVEKARRPGLRLRSQMGARFPRRARSGFGIRLRHPKSSHETL